MCNKKSYEKEIMRPKLAVTLFEDQVIRNYLGSSSSSFIDELEESFQVYILTNKDKVDLIRRFIGKDSNKIKDKILVLDPFEKKSSQTALNALSRILNRSTSNKWSRRRNYLNGQTKLANFVAKEVLYLLLSRFKLIKKVTRFLLAQTVVGSKNFLFIKEQEFEHMVLTSATNYEWDSLIGNICNKLQIETIGVPRSWDNLTSHGIIRFTPDHLIVFSENMKRYAVDYQDIKRDNIRVGLNPAYQYQQTPRQQVSGNKPRILYACMGQSLYEGEVLFIEFLAEIQSRLNSFELTILEHPKFPSDESINNYQNIQLRRLDYSQRDSAGALYKLLSQQDLVMTLGSSVALDCIFTSTPVVIVATDSNHKFWLSANRYIDTVEHFRDMVVEQVLDLITTREGVVEILEKYTSKKRGSDRRELEGLGKVITFEAPRISWLIKNTLAPIQTQEKQ